MLSAGWEVTARSTPPLEVWAETAKAPPVCQGEERRSAILESMRLFEKGRGECVSDERHTGGKKEGEKAVIWGRMGRTRLR